MRHVLLSLILGSIALFSGGCADNPVSMVGGFARVHITVQGTVLTEEGDAVSRAVVRIFVFEQGCEGSALTVISGLSPDSTGRFQETFWMISDPSPPAPACLRIVATPLTGTGLRAGSINIDNVLLVAESEPPSTIEVDITLS